jgi:peptidoglycan-associated lipoprotein
MSMSLGKLWCSLLVLVVAAAACHTRPPATAPTLTNASSSSDAARPPASAVPPPSAGAAAPPAAVTEAELFQHKSLDELNAERPLEDVFFDYDQNKLREDGRRVLQQDAQWLAKWPQTIVRIDGHCDDRGSAEYNLALGDRRAEVVREYLTSLGVKPDRIQTRSLGKESPFCREDGESCWSQNRRGHFMITAK